MAKQSTKPKRPTAPKKAAKPPTKSAKPKTLPSQPCAHPQTEKPTWRPWGAPNKVTKRKSTKRPLKKLKLLKDVDDGQWKVGSEWMPLDDFEMGCAEKEGEVIFDVIVVSPCEGSCGSERSVGSGTSGKQKGVLDKGEGEKGEVVDKGSAEKGKVTDKGAVRVGKVTREILIGLPSWYPVDFEDDLEIGVAIKVEER